MFGWFDSSQIRLTVNTLLKANRKLIITVWAFLHQETIHFVFLIGRSIRYFIIYKFIDHHSTLGPDSVNFIAQFSEQTTPSIRLIVFSLKYDGCQGS